MIINLPHEEQKQFSLHSCTSVKPLAIFFNKQENTATSNKILASNYYMTVLKVQWKDVVSTITIPLILCTCQGCGLNTVWYEQNWHCLFSFKIPDKDEQDSKNIPMFWEQSLTHHA